MGMIVFLHLFNSVEKKITVFFDMLTKIFRNKAGV